MFRKKGRGRPPAARQRYASRESHGFATRTIHQPKSGGWSSRKKRKPQMATDEHRFLWKMLFTRWTTLGIFIIPFDLCLSVFICGLNCIFKNQSGLFRSNRTKMVLCQPLIRNDAVGSATVSVALAGVPPASRMPWMIHHSVSIHTASKFSARRRKQRSRRPRSPKATAWIRLIRP
jgi:hypothetical protein